MLLFSGMVKLDVKKGYTYFDFEGKEDLGLPAVY